MEVYRIIINLNIIVSKNVGKIPDTWTSTSKGFETTIVKNKKKQLKGFTTTTRKLQITSYAHLTYNTLSCAFTRSLTFYFFHMILVYSWKK